jgi:uncharacterized membrane protein YfcA
MELVIIFLVGLIASFLGSFISGGFSILVFGLLTLFGYDTLAILGLLRLGLLGSNFGGFLVYQKAQKVVWKYVLPMTAIGVVASYIGAKLVIRADTEMIELLVGIAMILGALMLIIKPGLGVQSFVPGKARLFFSYIAYFFVVVWSTSVTIGVGLFNALVQTLGFGMSMLEVKGTNKIPALSIGIVALYVFAEAGLIDWMAGLVLFLGTLVGGMLGARGTLYIGDKWLKIIFVISVIIFAVNFLVG